VSIVLTLRAQSEWFMTGSRLSPRQRRGCRAVGASFIAAAALPLFAITPLAQADAGHGGTATVNQAPVAHHLRAIARGQAPQAQPAKPAQHNAANPAQPQAAKQVMRPAKQAKQQPAKPAVKGSAVTAPVAKAAHQPAAKGHAPAAHTQQPGSKAHQKVYVCHATNSDTNPYVVIWVSVASTQFQGHLAHEKSPNKFWKHDTMWNGDKYAKGTPKPDFIGKVGGTRADVAFCDAPGTTPAPTPSTTTTTTPSTTTTTATTPSTTTTTGSTPGPTVSGTKTTAPGQTKTPPGQTMTPPGQTKANPGAQVLPTKFTNSPTSDSQANAGTNTQVLGEKVSALPRTGADMVGAALLSLLMLTLGGLLLRLSAVRRRRTH
jgi:hypothetical protein